MTTSRSAARRSGRPSSWLVPAVGFVAYLGLAFALVMAQIRLDVPLPAWIVQAAPPLVYAALVFLVVRPPSAASLVGGTLLLWCAQLVLGALTEAFAGAVAGPNGAEMPGLFPPPPLPALLWATLLLVPLREMLGRDSRGPGARSAPAAPARAAVAARSPAPAAAAAVSAPAPVASPVAPARTTAFSPPRPPEGKPPTPEPRRVAPTEAPPPPSAMEEPAAAVEQAAPPSAAGRGCELEGDTHAHARPQCGVDDLTARDPSDDPIRISFGRVAAQLPQEAFLSSLDEIGAHLQEPGHLLIPRRVALGQLSHGVVRARWDVVADQFPRHLISMTSEEIKGRLAGGELILPIDEIVGQLPAELFRPAGPGPDVRGIELFPAPFHPVSFDVDTAHTAAPPASAPASNSQATPVEVSGQSAPSIHEPVPVSSPEDLTAVAEEIPSSREQEIGVALPLQEAEPAQPAATTDNDEEPEVSERSRDLESERAWLAPEVASSFPAHDASGDSADVREARALASTFVPGALEVRACTVDGVKILSMTSADIDGDLTVAVARLLLPVLAEGRAPWPVDQITLRGAGAAVVITPLGPIRAGGAVLAAGVPRGGALALLEMRCRHAAAGHASRGAPTDGGGAGFDDRDEPDLLDVEPATRVREVASSLGALGPVTASALRDAETDRALYLFLPPGSDARVMGELASDVSRAMRQAHAFGAVFRTAVLAAGTRRMVIRLPAGPSGRTHTIVAAGETTRPGLAYRQVERAAAALGAL